MISHPLVPEWSQWPMLSRSEVSSQESPSKAPTWVQRPLTFGPSSTAFLGLKQRTGWEVEQLERGIGTHTGSRCFQAKD